MTEPSREPDWEQFYQDYRKPGFIPGYEILNKLGGGAFGIVFKARKESIGKDYAVKFLKLDGPGMRGAVLRELEGVSLFAQVDHPNLVTIEDRGEVVGIPYILMGYAGEGTLRTRLDAAPMSREDALRIFAQVARGLQALHDHSLVHFDLKPGNVFLRGDIARIGDYGLSKLVSASHNSLSFGRGTPYYMAPEQLQQRGDARSDIYSLGVMLYESLSGDVPFRGDSEWEILRKHEEEEPHYPPSIEARERRVIERCMRKNPDERYQSIAELLDELFRTEPASPTSTPPIHHEARGRRSPGSSPGHARGAAPNPETVAPQPRPYDHQRRRHPTVRRGFVVFFGLMMLPFCWTAMRTGNRSSVSVSDRRTIDHRTPRAVKSRLGPLALPAYADRDDVRRVRDSFARLRRGSLSSEDATRRLQTYGPLTIVFGANELVSLDYTRRSDMKYCQSLHTVLHSITKFPFRCRTVPQGRRITRGIAARNRETANKFWNYVKKQGY